VSADRLERRLVYVTNYDDNITHHKSTRTAWQSPAVARQAHRMHPGEDIPMQRLSHRICRLRDVICNEAVPFRPHRGGVVSTQRVFVPGDL